MSNYKDQSEKIKGFPTRVVLENDYPCDPITPATVDNALLVLAMAEELKLPAPAVTWTYDGRVWFQWGTDGKDYLEIEVGENVSGYLIDVVGLCVDSEGVHTAGVKALLGVYKRDSKYA